MASGTVILRPLTGNRPDLRLEKRLLRSGVATLAAMDEVGRGALAGPVTVGVVLITAEIGRVPAGLRDSKLLSSQRREALVGPIRRWAPRHGVGHASPAEIDAVGIMQALRLAGERALDQAGNCDVVLLDGNHDWLTPPATLFEVGPALADDRPRPPVHLRVKADLSCAAVAAASVLAKTERDRIMAHLAPDYPHFGFEINKGYGTPEHKSALRRLGPSEVHRRSWQLGLS